MSICLPLSNPNTRLSDYVHLHYIHRKEYNGLGWEPQPFPHLADGFRFTLLGETIEVHISAILSALMFHLTNYSINPLI